MAPRPVTPRDLSARLKLAGISVKDCRKSRCCKFDIQRVSFEMHVIDRQNMVE